MRQGNAEVDLTGHCKDFYNTALVDKTVIERVNAEIKVNMLAILRIRIFFTYLLIFYKNLIKLRNYVLL